MQKVMAMAGTDSQAGKAVRDAREARDQVSDEIVRELRAKGLNAVRLDGPVPATPGANALIVTGQFDKIDEGNLRRRMVVGPGRGQSDVGASVELVYQPANEARRCRCRTSTPARTGGNPAWRGGDLLALGGVAGYVAMSPLRGGAAHGVSELRTTASTTTPRAIADAIAKQGAQVGLNLLSCARSPEACASSGRGAGRWNRVRCTRRARDSQSRTGRTSPPPRPCPTWPA